MYFKDTELADRFSVSRATIWRWVRIKHLPAPEKLSTGSTRWAKEGIDRFEAERKTLPHR